MTDRDLGDLLEHFPELDLPEGRASVLGHQASELVPPGGEVDVGSLIVAGDHQHDVRQEGHVLLPEGHQHQHQELAELLTELTHHPEVEEVDRVPPPQQVARVGIGVEEPVGQDLAVVRLQELARGLPSGGPLGRLADGDALDLLHHQEPGARVVAVDHGDSEPWIGLEIELPLKRLRQVLEDGVHVHHHAERRALDGLVREHLEQAEVAHDLLARGGTLDLHHHPVAVRERGPVHLGDGPRCHRHGVDALEDVLPRNPQLFLHHLDHALLRHGGHVVLQRGQLLDVHRRKEVRAGGQDLSELREGRPQRLERLTEPPGAHAIGFLLAALRPAEQLADAVRRQNLGDLRGSPQEVLVDRLDRATALVAQTGGHG